MSESIQVVLSQSQYSTTLFTRVVLSCDYSTSASIKDVLVTWVYKSFCKDPVLDYYSTGTKATHIPEIKMFNVSERLLLICAALNCAVDMKCDRQISDHIVRRKIKDIHPQPTMKNILLTYMYLTSALYFTVFLFFFLNISI